jgi:hypothetical protein
MDILIANLKHLYQRRVLWMVYAFLGFWCFMAIGQWMHQPEAGSGETTAVVIAAVVAGWIAAEMQMGVLVKPFAFCMPGHRQAVRKFVLSIAMMMGLAGSLVFSFYPGLRESHLAAVLCSAFFAILATCMITAWLGFNLRRTSAATGLILVLLLGSRFFDLPVRLEQAIVESPSQTIIVGSLLALAAWVRLGNRDFARCRCLRPWIGLGDTFSRERLLQVERARLEASRRKGYGDHPRPWVENLFMGRMMRQRAFSRARFVWGQMYVTFGLALSGWTSMWVPVLMISLFMGLGRWGIWGIWTMVMVGTAIPSRPALYSKMLVAGGRRERFYSTLAVTIASAFSLTLLGGAAILVSILLANILPELAVKGVQLQYHVIDTRMLYLPLVCVPLAAAVRLIFYPSIVIVVVVLVMLFYAPVMIFSFASRDELPNVPSPAIVLALASLCWLAFALILSRLATRRCLVR